MDKDINCTFIWQKYERGQSYLYKIDLPDKTDKAHRFYIGDQWFGIKSGGDQLPMFNFIKPIINYKVSTVCQKSMTAVYSPMDPSNENETRITDMVTRYFAKMWELSKMDDLSRKVVKDAAIAGDAYLYFGEGSEFKEAQIIDNINVFLGDEKDSSIQLQPYIIIRERRFVKDIRKEAEHNGIDKDDISLIVSDEDMTDQLGDKTDIDYTSSDGKCISLLYLYKDEDGFVHSIKSVRNVIYQPDKPILETYTDEDGFTAKNGLKTYPIVNFLWEDKKGSARGAGEVEQLIPNQLEVNKTLARRSITVKQVAFPKLVYNGTAIDDPSELDKAGAIIRVDDINANGVNNIISYLTPAAVAPDAKNLSDELIMVSKELAGAGDAALGSVNPEQTSGAAIIAARDQSVLPLNDQVIRFRQFTEDIALLWFDIWRVYNTSGIFEITEDGAIYITPQELENLRFNVKVDVCDKDPYSRYAEESALGNLFSMQAITFEEYVSLLSDDSIVPKAKLTGLIEKRRQDQLKQMATQMTQGGNAYEMQNMRDGNVQGYGSNNTGGQGIQL